MSPNHYRSGFGLFEFLVLSLAAAVVVGLVIGIACRGGHEVREPDRVSTLSQTGPRGPEAANPTAVDKREPGCGSARLVCTRHPRTPLLGSSNDSAGAIPQSVRAKTRWLI